jgi:hypothetical protein
MDFIKFLQKKKTLLLPQIYENVILIRLLTFCIFFIDSFVTLINDLIKNENLNKGFF